MKVKRELDGWAPTDTEWSAYEVWREHKILPYAGGWLEQPVSAYELFRRCGLLEELVKLNSGLREKK